MFGSVLTTQSLGLGMVWLTCKVVKVFIIASNCNLILLIFPPEIKLFYIFPVGFALNFHTGEFPGQMFPGFHFCFIPGKWHLNFPKYV
jgi:hypothetical protein